MPLARHDTVSDPRRYYISSFYSHASCEAWRFYSDFIFSRVRFYSHASCEAWQENANAWHNSWQFLLTCLLRGMTPWLIYNNSVAGVSTHMPLARHDDPLARICKAQPRFYSHASCEAWRMVSGRCDRWHTFLLTCLLRGMTCRTEDLRGSYRCFYSHASCEAWRSIIWS